MGSRGTTLATVAEPAPDLIRRLYDGVTKEDRLGQLGSHGQRGVVPREAGDSVRVLARVLRAIVSGVRNECATAPSVRFIEVSVQLLLRSASASAREALSKGKLTGLGAVSRGGVVWVQGGCAGKSWQAAGNCGVACRHGLRSLGQVRHEQCSPPRPSSQPSGHRGQKSEV